MTFTDARRRRTNARSGGVSPVFLGLLAVFALAAWGTWTAYGTGARLAIFVFVLAGWVISLCLHEYAHARSAFHGGDVTVAAKGYLRLNPFAYSHAMLSVVLPVIFIIAGGIGLPGGAVYIERAMISGRWKHSLVSAVGPLVNLLCAAALLVPLGTGVLTGAPVAFAAACGFLGFLQVTATLLNLLPVPGLDGYGIVEPWLSYEVRQQLAPISRFGLLAVFLVLWIPAVNELFFGWVYDLFSVFGVSPQLASLGNGLFRFWQ
ncbi:site-2 protease family protein [Streptomyces sp. NPDC059740]|uniref:site-2 protease family protein n=1 Tax=Streptomyces sp. NPDC059740 TaxID=3346926 RepID=UPI00364917ED